jgi:exonuclease III
MNFILSGSYPSCAPDSGLRSAEFPMVTELEAIESPSYWSSDFNSNMLSINQPFLHSSSIPARASARYSIPEVLILRYTILSLSIRRKDRRALTALQLWKPKSVIIPPLLLNQLHALGNYHRDNQFSDVGECALLSMTVPLLPLHAHGNHHHHCDKQFSEVGECDLGECEFSQQQRYADETNRHASLSMLYQLNQFNSRDLSDKMNPSSPISSASKVNIHNEDRMCVCRSNCCGHVNEGGVSQENQMTFSQPLLLNTFKNKNKESASCKETTVHRKVTSIENKLLKIQSANINSLKSKMDEIRVRIEADKPDFFVCQETKLNEKTDSSTLSVLGYRLYRKDRTEHGGGVALYVKDSFKVHLVSGVESDLELVAVRCKLKNKVCIIASVYKPPRTPNYEFIEKLTNFIASLGPEKENLIIAGDTNICALLPEYRAVMDLLEMINLKQLITTPTHNNRLIDQIFVSDTLVVHSAGLGPPVEKVHALTWANIYLPVILEEQQEQVVWKFRRADWLNMNIHLMKSDILVRCKNATNVNEAALLLQNSIKSAMTLFIPKGHTRNKKRFSWFSKEIERLFIIKRKAYNHWRRKQTNSNLSTYKSAKKKLAKEIYLAKKKYFDEAFSQCRNTSNFWSALNHFTGRKNKTEIPTLTCPAGNDIEDDHGKAELLCKQFVSVFRESERPTMIEFTSDDSIPKASIKLMLQIISRLPTKKAMGSDEIPAMVIKNCALVIAPCLTTLADISLATGEFPDIWKEALVSPIPKVNSSNLPVDYRPISLLPLMSKLTERLINKFLVDLIEPKLSHRQFGFRKGRSTVDALTTMQHFVFRGLEKCEKSKRATNVVVVFFDLAKAFDTVPHDRLLICLAEEYNLPKQLLAVLRSYLNNRTMKVKVNHVTSEPAKVTSGVPQGSILGPTLFIAFINSVAQLALSNDSELVLYADDLTLIHPICNSSSEMELQSDINLISSTINNLGLQMNSRKCKYLQISLSRLPVAPLTLYIQDEPLERTSQYKYLGVEVEEKFDFEAQTKKAVVKAKQAIGVLNRCTRKWASAQVLSYAINTIALPILLYAIEVWYPPHKFLRVQIERVNKFAARLITNDFNSNTPYDLLLNKTKWRSIHRRVTERRLSNVKKYMDGSRFVHEDIYKLSSYSTTQRSSQRLREKRVQNSLALEPHSNQKNQLEAKMVINQTIMAWNWLSEEMVRSSFSKFSTAILSDSMFHYLCEKGVLETFIDQL